MAWGVRNLISTQATRRERRRRVLWAPEGARIADNVAAAACWRSFRRPAGPVRGRDAPAHALDGRRAGRDDGAARYVIRRCFPTRSTSRFPRLALGALADCAGFRACRGVVGRLAVPRAREACARTLGIAGADVRVVG